jgi:hypothetical protein
LVAVALAAMVVGAPASAQFVPTSGPLPGSTFQGADGDHDDAPDRSLIDWQGLENAGRVQHNQDPNEDDSAFEGGSKELEPGGWGLTSESGGVTPAKSNVRDAWSAVDQPGVDTFVYFGFTRQDTTGTTFLTFELNRDDRLWNNGNAKIPCRRTGDVLISYEPHGNDPIVDVVIRRWTTTEADPDTDCARKGTLTTFTSIGASVAQAAMNSVSIAGRLPGALTGTLAAGRFGEASLNLSTLLQQAFRDDCLAFTSVWMHSRSSDSMTSNMQDYVAPQPLSVRTCSASGVKFFDSNADGERDEWESGIPGFLIWADYDNDGGHDDDEPFSVSDNEGAYVIDDIRPPNGTYWLRERLQGSSSVAPDWTCSFPNASTDGGTGSAPGGRFPCAWGLINAVSTANAEGRDFGNWYPAQLTIEKELFPADDPGRFDLLVNGEVVLAAAGDGASSTLSVTPGTFQFSERAVAGTDAADYRTEVNCRRTVTRFGRFRSGATFAGLELAAGQQGSCKFSNVRIAGPVEPPPVGSPAVAIRKRGPAVAVAGDRLRYALLLTNPGEVPFPADAVVVTDEQCDNPPRLVSKRGDDTPETLDPGDGWIYRCSRATAAGADCEPDTVENAGVVTATAGDRTVTDDDAITTLLLCPEEPGTGESDEPGPAPPAPLPPGLVPYDPPGPAPPRDPDVPGPVSPAGPTPPRAGAAGRARFEVGPATRTPRVTVSGTRISRARILVNRRLRRTLHLRILQRRVRTRITLAPGRHRVTARVAFELGSGTPPVSLTRTVRICSPRARAPRFTG